MTDFKVHVKRQADFLDAIEIIPVEKTGEVIRIFVPDGKGNWIGEAYHCGTPLPLKNVLTMPTDWAKHLYDGLYKLFGDPEREATTTELNATKYHLEDMRELVFKGKK